MFQQRDTRALNEPQEHEAVLPNRNSIEVRLAILREVVRVRSEIRAKDSSVQELDFVPDYATPLQKYPWTAVYRAQKGKGVASAYPKLLEELAWYNAQHSLKAGAEIDLGCLAAEVASIRQAAATTTELESLYHRLHRIGLQLLPGLKAMIEEEARKLTDINLFREKHHLLLQAINKDSLESFEPVIQEIAHKISSNLANLWDVEDLAKAVGVPRDRILFVAPPLPSNSPVIVQTARDFFDINSQASPCYYLVPYMLMYLNKSSWEAEYAELIHFVRELAEASLRDGDSQGLTSELEDGITRDLPLPFKDVITGRTFPLADLLLEQALGERSGYFCLTELVEAVASSAGMRNRFPRSLLEELGGRYSPRLPRKDADYPTTWFHRTIRFVSQGVASLWAAARGIMTDSPAAPKSRESFAPYYVFASPEEEAGTPANARLENIRSAVTFQATEFVQRRIGELRRAGYQQPIEVARLRSLVVLTKERYPRNAASFPGDVLWDECIRCASQGLHDESSVLSEAIAREMFEAQRPRESHLPLSADLFPEYQNPKNPVELRDSNATSRAWQPEVLYLAAMVFNELCAEKRILPSALSEATIQASLDAWKLSRSVAYALYHPVNTMRGGVSAVLRNETALLCDEKIEIENGDDLFASTLAACLASQIGPQTALRPISLATVVAAVNFARYWSPTMSDASALHRTLTYVKDSDQVPRIAKCLASNPNAARFQRAYELRLVLSYLSRDGAGNVFWKFGAGLAPSSVEMRLLYLLDCLLEFDLNVEDGASRHLRFEPGLILKGCEQPIPFDLVTLSSLKSTFWSVAPRLDSFGHFDSYVRYVSVAELLKLVLILDSCQVRDWEGAVRVFLRASQDLGQAWDSDQRLEALALVPPAVRRQQWSELMRNTQQRLSEVKNGLDFEHPLDVVLFAETLRLRDAPGRIPLVEHVRLLNEGVLSGRSVPLPREFGPGSVFLQTRRKGRESLPPGSPFIALFEYIDWIATYDNEPPEFGTLGGTRSGPGREPNPITKTFLEEISDRHYNYRNHKIDADSFNPRRDTVTYGNQVLELILDSLTGDAQLTELSLSEEQREEIMQELHIDELLAGVAAQYDHYSAEPLASGHREIVFVPTRGPLMEFAGDICGTCLSRLSFIAENHPDAIFVPFVRCPKANNKAGATTRLEGGSFVFTGELADGRRVFVVRGFNPSFALMDEVHVGSFFEGFLDYLVDIGRLSGVEAIVAPDEVRWGGALSNRQYVCLHVRRTYCNDESNRVELLPSSVSHFNECMISHVRVVRAL